MRMFSVARKLSAIEERRQAKFVRFVEEITGTKVTNPKTAQISNLCEYFRFRDNNFIIFLYDIQRYVSNDQAYYKLSDNKIDKKCKHLLNFPAVTLRALC
jgi:hypothetical protein